MLIKNVGQHFYFLQYCNFTDIQGVKFNKKSNKNSNIAVFHTFGPKLDMEYISSSPSWFTTQVKSCWSKLYEV